MSWETVKLGDVCKIVSGATPKTGNPAFWDGNVPWVTPKDLSGFEQKYINDTSRKITDAGLQSCSAYILPPYSVLFSSRAPIGLVAINEIPVCTNQGFKSMVPRNDYVYPDYLYWWLKIHRESIQKKGRGATFKEVSKKIVEDLTIPLPPLAEQKRIAAILDAADDLRAKRRESLTLLDTLLQSTFLSMFGDPITNPMGWERRTVGDALEDGLLEEVKDGNHGELHPKIADFSNKGVAFIMANCIHDGRLDLTKAYRLPEGWLEKLRVGFARGGDVLLSHKGTIGQVAVVPHENKVVILSPQVTYYRTSKYLQAHYLAGMFSANGFQRLLEKEAKQSTRAYIGITRQNKLPIIIPPLDLQRKFAAIVESVEGQKARTRAHLAELDILFASLQQRAFNGKL